MYSLQCTIYPELCHCACFRGGGSDHHTVSHSDLTSGLQRAHDARYHARHDGDDAARDVINATQDDSIVYNETPTKKHGSKLKSQRRGESFK